MPRQGLTDLDKEAQEWSLQQVFLNDKLEITPKGICLKKYEINSRKTRFTSYMRF